MRDWRGGDARERDRKREREEGRKRGKVIKGIYIGIIYRSRAFIRATAELT